jgi:hypothetical protein
VRRAVLLLALCACDGVFGIRYIDGKRDAPLADAPLPVDSTMPDTDASSTYFNEVLVDGPVGYFRLGEVDGPMAINQVPGGPDGTYFGVVQLGLAGALRGDGDTAIGLDRATTGYVDVGDNYDFPDLAPFSLEAWVKPPSPVDADYHEIVSKWHDPPGRAGIELFYIGNEVRFAREVDDSTLDTLAAGALPGGVYTHVVATYDGSMMRLYFNGSPVGSKASVLPLADNPISFQIGIGGSAGFTGTLDEVAVYNRALPQERVMAHYLASGQASGASHSRR